VKAVTLIEEFSAVYSRAAFLLVCVNLSGPAFDQNSTFGERFRFVLLCGDVNGAKTKVRTLKRRFDFS